MKIARSFYATIAHTSGGILFTLLRKCNFYILLECFSISSCTAVKVWGSVRKIRLPLFKPLAHEYRVYSVPVRFTHTKWRNIFAWLETGAGKREQRASETSVNINTAYNRGKYHSHKLFGNFLSEFFYDFRFAELEYAGEFAKLKGRTIFYSTLSQPPLIHHFHSIAKMASRENDFRVLGGCSFSVEEKARFLHAAEMVEYLPYCGLCN